MSETPGNELRPRAQSRGELRERSSGGSTTRIPGIARHGRLPKSKPWLSVLKFMGASLAVLLVAGVTVGAIAVGNIAVKVADASVVLVQPTDAPPPQFGAVEGGFNLLIVGSDTRVDQDGIGGTEDDVESELNDVNLLLHVAADQQSAVAISFPRDLVVGIPECAWEDGSGTKAYSTEALNTAMYYGGLNCVAQTITELTGLPIQYAGIVTFQGVASMSDAVGGVNVCTTGPVVDPHTGIDLPIAGQYTLAGGEALAFLRTRYGVGDGSDITRISSQQVFLSSLVRKIKSEDTLGDFGKVYNLATAALDNMRLSDTMANVPTLAALALAIKDVPLERVMFVQYPGTTGGSGIYEGKVQPIEGAASEMMALIAADQPFAFAAAGDDAGSTLDTSAAPIAPTVDNSALPVLPSVITGQLASDQTCSVANDY